MPSSSAPKPPRSEDSFNSYVYAHLRADGTPFYVGKGTGRRAWKSYRRSRWWKSIVKADYPESDIPEVLILSENLSTHEAFAIEQFWIAVWGRKDERPDGVLVNLTAGGEGGVRPSIHTRNRLSARFKGAGSHNFGKTLPASTRQRISASLAGPRHPQYGKRKEETYRYGHIVSNDGRDRMSKSKVAPIVLRDPEGGLWTVQNRNAFARSHNLSPAKISRLVKGTALSHHGWRLHSPRTP